MSGRKVLGSDRQNSFPRSLLDVECDPVSRALIPVFLEFSLNIGVICAFAILHTDELVCMRERVIIRHFAFER